MRPVRPKRPGKLIETRPKMSYKRPIPRSRGNAPTQFVSNTLPGGGVASQWTTGVPKPRIPSGHPSVVGQILDKMRQGFHPTRPKRTVWTPPMNHEFVAKHMDNPEPFLKRCEDWYREHPRLETVQQDTPVLDPEPLITLFAKYTDRRPPCEEMCAAMIAAGHTELRVAKYRQWWQNIEATSDERQGVIDLIFAKFPSANKPTPKTKTKKVIKVVKKKMPDPINE